MFDGTAEEALEAARALLRDAENGLTEAFGTLDWVDGDRTLPSQRESTCWLSPPTRELDIALGRDTAQLPALRSALTTAAAKHGLPPASEPTVGTGGWLSSETAGRGLRLEFLAKGQTELSTSVVIDGTCPA